MMKSRVLAAAATLALVGGTYAASSFAAHADTRGLRRSVDDVSRLRFTLVHECAHRTLDGDNPNFTGMAHRNGHRVARRRRSG